jgi:flavodoxin
VINVIKESKRMTKTKRSLIIYQSMTGNTEKVALSFQRVFNKKGWQCDVFKMDKDTNFANLPFNFEDYDFMCAGSGVYMALPGKEITDVMFKYTHEPIRNGKIVRVHSMIFPGPQAGVVFVTYAGIHLGPKEAEPALSLLELNIEHLRFKCIGRFSCPGGGSIGPTPGQWFGDIRGRPNKRDLQKAEIFMEEILEEPHQRE